MTRPADRAEARGTASPRRGAGDTIDQPLAGTEIQEFPWGTITWHASSELKDARELTIGRVLIRAGRSNPRHRHPNCEEALHLLSGRLRHSLGSTQVELVAGDTLVIPRNVFHNAEAVGGQDAEMVIAFSSAEREYEPEEGRSA